MNKTVLVAATVSLALSFGTAFAQEEDVVQVVMEGCAAEIENYCSQVTLGEGRLLACFFAHEDKLSGQCQYALYQGAVALDQAINALIYVTESCSADIVEFCGDVQEGEGRILNCLISERDNISEECATAMEEVEE